MFDIALIQWLQSLSSATLDQFFILITNIGSHYAYMLIIPFVYWTVDRHVGRRLAALFLSSMWLNGLIKEYLTLPRPDPELVQVLVDEPSPGFPSGHAQGAITLWGYLAIALKRPWLTWLAVALVVLIPVSRLYLGVHHPADVVGGLVIGALLILGFLWLTGRKKTSGLSIRWRMFLTLIVPLLLYPLYQTGTSEQIIGFFVGFFTADLLAGQVVPFRERVSLNKQLAKLLVGYSGFAALVVLHMLFVPVGLPGVLGYSLIALWIALGAPALFRMWGLAGDDSLTTPLHAESRRNLRHYLATAAAVLIIVVGSSVYVRQAIPIAAQPAMLQADRVLVIGHRGAAGLAPENTLVAFQTGLQHGVDILELDIWLTQDGEVVVIHDATVNRTTNGTGRVADMTLDEIQSLDAGYRFTTDGGQTFPWRGQGVVVPTLRQLLAELPEAVFLIELKDASSRLVDAALAIVDSANARDRVMFASFHDVAVQRVRQLAPDIPTSYGSGEATNLVIWQRLGLAAFVKPVAQALQLPEWQGALRVANPGLARLARRQSLQLHAWTINDEETMHRMIGLGASGIITDFPDRLQRVLAVLEGRDLGQVFY